MTKSIRVSLWQSGRPETLRRRNTPWDHEAADSGLLAANWLQVRAGRGSEAVFVTFGPVF
jgi:hypothetical protein